MKQRGPLFIVLISIICIGLIISCSKSNSGGSETNTANKAILTNIGNNIIIPSYQNLSTAINAFDASVIAFTTSPAAPTLTDAQNAFKDAYEAWQACSEFGGFGPASDQSLFTANVNVFPTNTTTIQNNINSGVYTIDGFGNLSAQGFPALDYLLFGADNVTVLAKFTTDSKAANAKQYLAAVSAAIKTKVTAVLNAWQSSGGNYINQFINATGVDAGSSLSMLINFLVYDYDVILKNYKIGIPFGKYGASVIPQDPTKVEGYYSDLSVQLLIKQMQAIQNIYLGGSGDGLDDKVASTSATKNGSPLNDVIKNQITTVITKLQALPSSLSNAIQTNSPTVNEAYTEVQKLVVLLKVDLTSALGIKISFQDDDGD